jgi:aryl-alcohol dehydrogenase-like predicted oxidoreductase
MTPTSISPALALPNVGVGCFSFGGGAYWGEQSQKDVNQVVDRALELGLNLFDTAETYNNGASEIALGQALAGQRNRAQIASKIQPDFAYRDTLRARCEASLRRLKTDWIDIYMLHWPLNSNAMRHYTSDVEKLRNPPGIGEALETMAALKAEGKIRYIGISNFGVAQMKEAVAVGVPITVNEMAYGLLMRAAEAEVMPYCAEHGIGIFGYMPLSQGLLSDKVSTLDELPAARTRTRHFRGDRPGSRHGGRGFEEETMSTLNALRREAGAAGIDLSDLALAWAIANPHITSVLVGARNLDQLGKNFRGAQISINPALAKRLDEITHPLAQRMGDSIDYFQSIEDSRSY